jgi:DNA polymerase III alpha subunit (gram-positive type)
VAEEMTLVFDLETNGLLNDVTRIHCIAIYDSTTDEIETYNDEKNNKYSITEGLNKLLVADTIVGHNIIGYDIPCISKLYNFFTPRCRVVDTLLLSRLYHPNRFELDEEKQYAGMELQHFGRHSLRAYGYRLGEYKGKFGQTSDWSEWSQEMEDYCVQDVEVTKKLCNYFLPYLTGSR